MLAAIPAYIDQHTSSSSLAWETKEVVSKIATPLMVVVGVAGKVGGRRARESRRWWLPCALPG